MWVLTKNIEVDVIPILVIKIKYHFKLEITLLLVIKIRLVSKKLSLPSKDHSNVLTLNNFVNNHAKYVITGVAVMVFVQEEFVIVIQGFMVKIVVNHSVQLGSIGIKKHQFV